MGTLAEIYGGVDTHRESHTAVVTDGLGGVIATDVFAATPEGYRRMFRWLTGHGQLVAVGIEGTGSYGAGLARHLASNGVDVREVVRPNRQHRRRHGKSDAADAVSAARAVISGDADGMPRSTDPGHPLVGLRILKRSRDGAVKQRTATINQLHAAVATAPQRLQHQLDGLSTRHIVEIAARYRPTNSIDPIHATKMALRFLARRIQTLTEEITQLDTAITPLVTHLAQPELLDQPGVGINTAADLLITIGDNPQRIRNEAAFAALCGTSPIDASSGRQQRHRLNRGGDRHANAALYRITIVRLRHHQPTRTYMQRRLAEGKTKKETIRCLKRHLARQLYKHLT